MTDTYLHDLLEQPDALQLTLDYLAKLTPLELLRIELNAGHYKHVILTGMGSSYHALYPLQLRMFAEEINAVRLETSELIHHGGELITPSSLIVAVSQSGQSAEVVHLLELCRNGAMLVGVTNTAGSSLAQGANQVILTRAGEESSVSCKTYISALAALVWLGDQILGGAQISALWGIPEKIAEYWSSWQDSVELLCKRLKDVEQLFLLGRGVSLTSASAGALIIKEAARVSAEGMSSAAFRHGPLELVSRLTFALVYLGEDHTLALNTHLAQDIRSVGGQVETVGMARKKPPFGLPMCSPCALPILEILPTQMISLALAQLKGIVAGQFIHTGKVTAVE